jgi:CubicO group peptidase (beta-lactamase class C family)
MNKKVSKLMILFFILGCLTMAACGGLQDDNTSRLTRTEPGSNDISDVLRKTEEMPYLKSLIVIKNGEVIIEKYMNGGGPEVYTDLKSASKSILSAVLGVAINKGYLDSIDQKVMDFFPEYITADLDPRIFDLRIRHLITMKSGFKVKESSKAYEQLYQSSDWIRHILHLPFKTEPGKEFNYHSFNPPMGD